jgi:hypothetical protein
MSIIARRFSIFCLVMGLFAMGLTMAVQNAERRNLTGTIGLAAPCPQPSGIHCRVSL